MVDSRTRKSVLGTPDEPRTSDGIEDVPLPDMPDEPNRDVAIPVSGEIAVGGPAMQSLMEWVADRTTRDDQDDFAAMERTIARILAGEDAEQVLRRDTPVKGEDIADRPFLLHGFDLTESDFEEGFPVYANLHATMPGDPVQRVVNIGGLKVLAALKRLEEIGEWPVEVMIVVDGTRKGHSVNALVAPDAATSRRRR